MNLPQVYMCSPSWTLLPPPSPYHPSGSSQCTSPKHPVSCIEPGLVTHFIHDILHVSMPFSQIFPPSPSYFLNHQIKILEIPNLLERIKSWKSPSLFFCSGDLVLLFSKCAWDRFLDVLDHGFFTCQLECRRGKWSLVPGQVCIFAKCCIAS